MAGIRGRGISTGKSLSILFRLIADGSQARAEIAKTSKGFAKEIRAAENVGQRLLSIFSRPLRGRLGFGGALGISFVRDQLRELAKTAIETTGTEAEKTGAKVKKATSSLTGMASSAGSAAVALRAIRSAEAAQHIVDVGKAYSDASFAVKTFEGVLARTQNTLTKDKTFGPQFLQGDNLKSVLKNLGVTPSREAPILGKTGISFRDKDSEVALAEFIKGFNSITDSAQRAAIAARLFGSDVGKMLPILEAEKLTWDKMNEAAKKFEEASLKITALEKARAEFEAAKEATAKRTKNADELEIKRLQIMDNLASERIKRMHVLQREEIINREGLSKTRRVGDDPRLSIEEEIQLRLQEHAQKLQGLEDAITKQLQAQAAAKEAVQKFTQKNIDLQELQNALKKTEEEESTRLMLLENVRAKIVKSTIQEREARTMGESLLGDPADLEMADKLAHEIGLLTQSEKRMAGESLVATEKMEKLRGEIKDTAWEAQAAGALMGETANKEVDANMALAKAKEVLATDFVTKTDKKFATNTTIAEEAATQAAAEAVVEKAAADKLAKDELEKKLIVQQLEIGLLGESAALYKLNAKQLDILSRALTLNVGKDKDSLVGLIGQMTGGAKTGGPNKISTPGTKLDPGELTTLEGFIQKFAGFSTEAERAAFATEVLGEKLASELLPALSSIVPPVEAATEATTVFGLSLGTIAIGAAVAVAGLAILEVAFFFLAKSVAKSDATMARMAERTGISAENISLLDAAARKANLGGLKSIQERIGGFDKILGQAARGNLPEVAFLLRKLGIDAQTAGKDTNAALVKVIEAYNTTSDATQRASISLLLFNDRTGKVGLTFQEMGPKVAEFNALIKDQGTLLTAESAKAALQFDRALTSLEERFKSLGVSLGRALVPGMTTTLTAAEVKIGKFGSIWDWTTKLIGNTTAGIGKGFLDIVAIVKTASDRPGAFGRIWSGDPGFWNLAQKNIDDLKKKAEEIQDSPEEVERKLNETLKKEEQASKQRIQLAEIEKDARLRIEHEYSEGVKREENERKISHRQAVASQLQSDQNAAGAQKALLQQQMIEAQNAYERATDPQQKQDAKNQQLKIQEEINKLDSDFQQNRANTLSEFNVHQREQREQAAQEELAQARAVADEKIDILNAENTRLVTSKAFNLVEIGKIEKAQSILELKELNDRLAAVGQNEELKRQLTAQKLLKESQMLRAWDAQTRAEDDQKFQDYEAILALRSSRLQTRELILQNRISAIRDAAQQRNVAVADRAATQDARIAVVEQQQNIKRMQDNLDLLNEIGDTEGIKTLTANILDAYTELFDRMGKVTQEEMKDKIPITYAQAEMEIKDILVAGLDDQITINKEKIVNAELHHDDTRLLYQEEARLEQTRVGVIQQAARDIRDAYKREREDTRQIMASTNSILKGARETHIQTQLDQLNILKDRVNVSTNERVAAVHREAELNRMSENENHRSNAQKIADDKAAAMDSNLNAEEYWARQGALNLQGEAEAERHAAAMKAIREKEAIDAFTTLENSRSFEQGLQGVDPFQAQTQRMREQFALTGKTALKMGDMGKMGLNILGNAVSSVAEATGSLVENWVLLGKTGPAALRKMTAQILASLAKQATVEAIMELARGFAALARAFFGDPRGAAEAAMHFKSAALFGVVAAVAAVGGRAVAGDLFAEQSADKTTKDKTAKDEIERKNEGRKQYVEHIHRVVVTGEKGFVARQFVDEIKSNNQEVRRAVNTAAK